MATALELSHLPSTATWDELRAISAADAIVFSCAGPGQQRALLMFSSQEAAATAASSLDGADWGSGMPVAVRPVTEGEVGWIASQAPGMATPSAGFAAAAAPRPRPLQPPQPQAAAGPPFVGGGGGGAASSYVPEEWLPKYDVDPPSWGGEAATDWQPEAAPRRPPSSSSAAPRRPSSGGSSSAGIGGRPGSGEPFRPRDSLHINKAAALWIGNIDGTGTEEGLRSVCSQFGPIVFCKLYPSKIPTRMCYCIVEFKRPDAAAAALEALDRCVWEEVSQHPLRVKFREI